MKVKKANGNGIALTESVFPSSFDLALASLFYRSPPPVLPVRLLTLELSVEGVRVRLRTYLRGFGSFCGTCGSLCHAKKGSVGRRTKKKGERQSEK